MDLITVLEATLSPDTNHIHQAEQGLKQAAEADLVSMHKPLQGCLIIPVHLLGGWMV